MSLLFLLVLFVVVVVVCLFMFLVLFSVVFVVVVVYGGRVLLFVGREKEGLPSFLSKTIICVRLSCVKRSFVETEH